MTIPLLKTKLNAPPVRPDLVSRPRLIERLEERLCLGCRLTLISAPAGFGKTTLVTEWLRNRERPSTWLSLDEGDNDPVRFWTYLIAAIQAVHPEVGQEARQIVGAPQLRSAEPAVVSLLNEIAELTGDLVLVLDDYHAIQAEQIHKGLSYLLDHQPPNLHLVLITRADPPLSLARLRAHGQLIEIRAADLQFSSDEAAMLFNEKMHLSLEPKQVAALHLRTEGWIVGLRLAALLLQGHPTYDTFIEQFTGSHRFILEYLTEEVVRTLPDAQRQFLLRTSILDRFCGALCHAVTGNAACHRLLDEIRVANLFLVPLDTVGRWFRYHHLFAGLLRTLLERDHPDEIGALHLKAAAWFDEQGYAGEAVDHALRSGDMAQAKELILKHWFPWLSRGEVTTVLRWLDALPEKVKGEDPSVALASCWALYLSGQSLAIAPHLEHANDAYERVVSAGTLTGAQQSSVAAQLAMLRSVLASNRADHTGSIAHAEEAVRLVPPEDQDNAGTAWSMLGGACAGAGDYDRAIEAHERGAVLMRAGGDLIGAFMATFGRAMYMIIQGRLAEAGQVCRSAIERAAREGHGEFPATGWLHVGMAKVELERYCLDRARTYLDDGLRIARPGGSSVMLRSGSHIRAHLAAARGDLDAAVDILHAAEQVIDAMDDPYLSGELNREWTMLYLSAGELDAARAKLHVLLEKGAATQHADLLLARDWMTARLLCAEGRFDEALDGLDEAIQRVRATNSTGELIRLLALQAVAHDAKGKRGPARSALREAVALGAPEGYIRRWLDAGPSIASLLRDLRDKSSLPRALHAYLDALLDACQSTFGDAALHPTGDMLDPLTARELEVMRLICAGYSNQDIADELVVALNTVKRHTTNIYSKLEVRSRTQAVARAHGLGLV